MSIPKRQIQQLQGHQGAVHFIIYSIDGMYCLSGGGDRSVKLWNPSTGLCIKTYTGHGKDIYGIAM